MLYQITESTSDAITSYPDQIGKVRGVFINGKKESLWSKYQWTTRNDKFGLYLRIEETYKDGLLHGIRRIYGNEGKVLQSTLFVEGTGIYREYYIKNDKLFINGILDGGKRYGCWTYYSPEGARIKTENYENGLLHGEYKAYNDRDSLLYETTFVKGTGYYKAYDEKGELLEEGKMEDGYRLGMWKEASYYFDRNEDKLKKGLIPTNNTKESPDNNYTRNLIDIFYIDDKPFYIRASERKASD